MFFLGTSSHRDTSLALELALMSCVCVRFRRLSKHEEVNNSANTPTVGFAGMASFAQMLEQAVRRSSTGLRSNTEQNNPVSGLSLQGLQGGRLLELFACRYTTPTRSSSVNEIANYFAASQMADSRHSHNLRTIITMAAALSASDSFSDSAADISELQRSTDEVTHKTNKQEMQRSKAIEFKLKLNAMN